MSWSTGAVQAAPPPVVQPRPVNPGSRIPVIAVTVVIAIFTVPTIVSILSSSVLQFPLLGVASLIVWSLYAIPFIWIIRRIDYFEPEGFWTYAMAFVWGGFVATALAISANEAIASLLVVREGSTFENAWGAAVAGPATEEVLKAIGIVAVMVLSPRRPRSALDGFVVGAMVGLGFQVVENFVYTVNWAGESGDDSLIPLVMMFVVRGLFSGLWSHAVYTGIVGIGIGYAITAVNQPAAKRIAAAVVAFLAAYLLHFWWNSPYLVETWGVLGMLFKGAVTLAILWLALILARSRDAQLYISQLVGVDPYWVSDQEREYLATAKGRRAERKLYKRYYGPAAVGAVRRLQRDQADLAVGIGTRDQQMVNKAAAGIRAFRGG